MKKSKKGITLVELVICCAILVLLGGACTAVLVSGEKVFSGSAYSANTQMEANVLQTFLYSSLPTVETVDSRSVDECKAATKGVYLFFDENDVLTINASGKLTRIKDVQSLVCKFEKAGAANSSTAKAQFVYTVVMKDGTTFSGGLVLINMPYNLATMGVEDPTTGKITPIEYDIKTTPAAFDPPETT